MIMMGMIVMVMVVYCIVYSIEDVGESIVDNDDGDGGDSDSNAIGDF